MTNPPDVPLWLPRYCDLVANDNALVPRKTRESGITTRTAEQEGKMKNTIKWLLDPRQQTNWNNTSKNGKETEMKNRMISKKAILGLAIGTGLIVGFSVLSNGAETRAFNPAETALAVNAEMVIDESQEVGGYPAATVRLPHELAFDESQENGFMTTTRSLVIDESQEVGGYPASKRTPVQGMVIDESQEGL